MAFLCVRVLLMLLLGIVAGRLVAAAPAPAPAVDCLNVLSSMTDCFTFVTGASSAAPPPACCTELASVVKNNPQCLCQLYNTTFTVPIGINISQAMLLPVDCKVTTPDPSRCASYGVPVPGPVGSTSPGMAPSPASSTASSPKASSPSSPKSSSPKSSSPPKASTSTATQPNVSDATTAPSSPNTAHEIGAWNVGAAAMSLLLIVSMFFS